MIWRRFAHGFLLNEQTVWKQHYCQKRATWYAKSGVSTGQGYLFEQLFEMGIQTSKGPFTKTGPVMYG